MALLIIIHNHSVYFIEISMFCKCKQASSKHIQNKKVYGHSTWPWPGGSVVFQQKAGFAQHRNEEHGACPRPGGYGPP